MNDPYWRRLYTAWIDYVWQGQALAEAWYRRDGDGDGNDSGPSTRIERWHFEPDGVRPLAREALVADGRHLADATLDSEWLVIVADQIGTPTALFDTGGAQRWKCDATLWGRARTARDLLRACGEDHRASHDQPSCALRFPGQWKDAESGLHFNLNRYYDPDTGQYLSPDPVGVDGGLRTHAYVNNPLAWMDPLGLAECNWGQWFARKTGSLPPAEMPRPHAHHIVFKGPFANNPPMQSALTRSRNVLSKYGIDPVNDHNTLTWAPNRGHSVANTAQGGFSAVLRQFLNGSVKNIGGLYREYRALLPHLYRNQETAERSADFGLSAARCQRLTGHAAWSF